MSHHLVLSSVIVAAGLSALFAADQPSIIAPGAKLQVLGDTFAFTEGPSADKHGNVYFTDQPNDRIVKWSTDGKLSDWLKPAGRSNGTYFDQHGNLITCADEKNELWSISPDKKVTVLVKDSAASFSMGLTIFGFDRTEISTSPIRYTNVIIGSAIPLANSRARTSIF